MTKSHFSNLKVLGILRNLSHNKELNKERAHAQQANFVIGHPVTGHLVIGHFGKKRELVKSQSDFRILLLRSTIGERMLILW